MCTPFRGCGSLLGPAVLQVCLLAFTSSAARAEGWSRVAVSEPAARSSLHSALDSAVQWWTYSPCRAILTEFLDEHGCPLSEKLAALKTTFETYLQWVVIQDASGGKRCENLNQFAFTAAGSRVVFVCGKAFRRLWERDAERATAVLIHEVLHTLGLGENGLFPSSRDITRIVLERCHR